MARENCRTRPWAKISDPQRGIVSGNTVDVRPLILAAHPDDETIGASVAMTRMREATVVFLTDGAPRDPQYWSPDAKGSREDYIAMRKQEALAALSVANVPAERIFWLGAIDQEAIENLPALVAAFVEVVSEIQPDIIITHPYEGGHPDHDAAALIAWIAVRDDVLRWQPEILEMTSYHLRDGRCVSGEFLPGTGGEELTLCLSPEERSRKERMIASHHSQRFVLQRFSLDTERLRPAPSYDFTQPPHPGKLWYECLGWPMTGEQWRELAAAALLDLRQTT
ncbi:MAG TPA: PIG-L family deacetylase [Terriglobales bacterium]|nr:PIG-L family deacetylase [Terriglobales bacterium]